MASTPEVRLATSSDTAAMAATLARAFHDDPVKLWLIHEGPQRQAKAERLFDVWSRMHLRNGCTYTTDGVQGAALWEPPGHWKTPPLEILRHAPALIRIFGTALPGDLRILSEVEKRHARAPHYYLAVLGTDPAHQGKGIGGALMGPVLERADREGVGAYLESSKESNIAFYHRFGFDVTGTYDFPKGGPRIWLMWRDPKG
jgi:GNAT superfamily N-acetyltransferase